MFVHQLLCETGCGVRHFFRFDRRPNAPCTTLLDFDFELSGAIGDVAVGASGVEAPVFSEETCDAVAPAATASVGFPLTTGPPKESSSFRNISSSAWRNDTNIGPTKMPTGPNT